VLYVMRAADAWPAVLHVFRAVPPRLSAAAAAAHDEALYTDFAQLCAMTLPELAALPLANAVRLPHRVGGRALPSARLLGGVAYASARVQVARVCASIGGPVPPAPPGSVPPFLVRRPGGRPAVGGWQAAGRPGLCSGAARCRLPPADGCARARCSCCCVLSATPCAGCVAAADAALASPVVSDALAGEVAAALQAVAAQIPAPQRAVRRAFALAAQFQTPQRALTCAVHGRCVEVLRAELSAHGRAHELLALESMADPAAFAIYVAAPLRPLELADDALMVALRTALDAPILSPQSLLCQTVAGREGKPCPVATLATAAARSAAARADARAADRHARTCKRGGGVLRVHNHVVAAVGGLLTDWGVPNVQEARDFLPGECRMDNLCRASNAVSPYLAADLTRRDDARLDALAAAERGKEDKYAAIYQAPVLVRGFAFNQFGRIGPQARELVNRWVAAGVRACGAHPDDLRSELLATFGHALHTAQAHVYARFAAVNGDKGMSAPREAALVPAGQRRPGGVRVRRKRPRAG